jgi:hypothetical protein
MSKNKTGLVLLAVFTLRCATITSGRSEKISIASDPPGSTATITCSGQRVGTAMTPGSITIPRRAADCELTVFHEGHEPEVRILKRRVSGRVAANAIGGAVPLASFGTPTIGTMAGWLGLATGFGLVYGGVGTGIDFATGSAYRHSPDTFRVTLRPSDRAR